MSGIVHIGQTLIERVVFGKPPDITFGEQNFLVKTRFASNERQAEELTIGQIIPVSKEVPAVKESGAE